MRCSLRVLLCGLVGLAFLPPLHAADAKGSAALKLMPKEADLVVEMANPKAVVDAFVNDGWLQQIQELQAVRELYQSTNYRRFYQLVAYFEKELGVAWPEAVQRLAGDGAVFGVKVGPNPPVLLVVKGTDEKLVKKFVATALEVLEQELARQESKQKIEKSKYRDVEVMKIGNARAAVAGSAILVSNKDEALKKAIDLQLDGAKDQSVATVKLFQQARAELPKNPLFSVWFNLDPVHNAPGANAVFDMPTSQPILTVIAGGLIDVVKRSPYLSAAAYSNKKGFEFTVRMPSGKEGMPKVLSAHVPSGDTPGSLPLLKPKNALYSSSYYIDVVKFWEHRKEFLNDQQLKAFENFNDRSGRFLLGNKFSDLIAKFGPHQRIVVANQPKAGYTKQPKQRIPKFAFVAELRDPKFGTSLEALIRAGGLLATTQVKVKLFEEKIGDVKLYGYRFDEDAPLRQDQNDLRFNFSPCFATVGDQFVAASTIDMCKELVDQISKESKTEGSKATSRDQWFATGIAQALKVNEEQLVLQTILNQSLPVEDARKEVAKLINLVRELGVLRSEMVYGDKDFRYDIKLIRKK